MGSSQRLCNALTSGPHDSHSTQGPAYWRGTGDSVLVGTVSFYGPAGKIEMGLEHETLGTQSSLLTNTRSVLLGPVVSNSGISKSIFDLIPVFIVARIRNISGPNTCPRNYLFIVMLPLIRLVLYY